MSKKTDDRGLLKKIGGWFSKAKQGAALLYAITAKPGSVDDAVVEIAFDFLAPKLVKEPGIVAFFDGWGAGDNVMAIARDVAGASGVKDDDAIVVADNVLKSVKEAITKIDSDSMESVIMDYIELKKGLKLGDFRVPDLTPADPDDNYRIRDLVNMLKDRVLEAAAKNV